MSDIIRRNPFREMVSMRNAMDRMFEDALIGPEWDWRQASSCRWISSKTMKISP